MAARLPIPDSLRRWLLQYDGFRVKVIGSFALGLVAILVLGVIFLLVAVQLYEANAARHLGIDRLELLKTAGYGLAGLAALSGLVTSSWLIYKAHDRQLENVHREAEQARAILDGCPNAILTVDINGIIHDCNPATERMFGYESGELIGERIARLIPQRNFLHDVAALGRGALMAFGQRRNFLTFQAEVSVAEARNASGQRTFIVSVHDASGRRHSEETLHHISLGISSMTGEEFVRNLLQQLSQVLQNDFAFVLESDKRPGTAFSTLMIAEHGRIRSKSTHSIAGTVFQAAQSKGFAAFPCEVRTRFPHDTILADLEAESFIGTALNDPYGQSIGLIGVISRTRITNMDVSLQTLQIFAARAAAEIARKQEAERLASRTERLHDDFTLMRATAERERKRYEEDIAAEQELLAVTLRSIREGCITTDNNGEIMMLNPVAEDLTGWTQPEAADRPLGDILQLTGRRNRRTINANLLLESPEQFNTQMVLTSREGTERLIEASAAPIRNREERKLGNVIVLRDVTERSRAEEEYQKAEKLESLGLAAGGIAHDFNNLLTAIIGNLSLAAQTTTDKTRDRIEASKKASLRAQDLAQQLLTFAKGGAPIKKTASMRQLLLDTVGFSLSGTNIRSDLRVDEDLWPVDVDAGQISQVIGNLAVNAVQAMPTGGTLHVTGFNTTFELGASPPPLGPGRYVCIHVRDEGTGISEEAQKKIFDPYFTTKPKGSGLGLATSYSIIKNHDGLITVSSAPGEGALFTIYLPASDAEVVAEITPTPQEIVHRGKVLVLDDEEVICELVAYALTPLGYEVEQAYDSLTMLAMYREAMEKREPFDAVVMDLTIPGGMGGKEAIVKLLELDPQARAIVSSGYAMDPIMSRYREYGFSGVIAKPYDIDELAVVIANTISAKTT